MKRVGSSLAGGHRAEARCKWEGGHGPLVRPTPVARECSDNRPGLEHSLDGLLDGRRRTMHSLGDMLKSLNRASVYVGGLQARFELPVMEGAGEWVHCRTRPGGWGGTWGGRQARRQSGGMRRSPSASRRRTRSGCVERLECAEFSRFSTGSFQHQSRWLGRAWGGWQARRQSGGMRRSPSASRCRTRSDCAERLDGAEFSRFRPAPPPRGHRQPPSRRKAPSPVQIRPSLRLDRRRRVREPTSSCGEIYEGVHEPYEGAGG